ncbi:BlaI/MecI/CopY family transcriptional regulator [Candidatus Poribacteria bacterium]|nr:BlaI/MecI/CopY family transcriptional regulator [Candidatus Poribacteria bacterium]
MSIRKQQTLTDLEADVMQVVWQRGQATVRDVYEKLRSTRNLAYTTIMTVMSTLAKKGVVEYSQQGRAYVYRPKISKNEAAQRSVAKVLQKFFDGSPRALVAHLIDANAISPDELSSLQQLLNSKQKEN